MPCAKAARTTIVEVEEIVDTDKIRPEDVHLPSIYVQYITKGDAYQKRIEVNVYNYLITISMKQNI